MSYCRYIRVWEIDTKEIGSINSLQERFGGLLDIKDLKNGKINVSSTITSVEAAFQTFIDSQDSEVRPNIVPFMET